MKLTKAEEFLMILIWNKGEIFMKQIIDAYPEPKPAATTIATLLKRLQTKKFVGYTTMGNSRQYYPLVKKAAYFTKSLKSMMSDFFGDSSFQFASFFAKNTDMTRDELESLKEIIDSEINKKES